MIAGLSDLKLERWLRARESGALKWKTKNGDEISIKRMSDSHLENAIKMIEKMADNEEKRTEYEELKCEYEAYIDALDNEEEI